METRPGPSGARGVIIDVVVSAVVPVIVFQLARRLGAGEVPALGCAAVPPAAVAVAGLVRRRTLDPIAAIVLLGLVVSAIGFALGGGPRIILIRESFLTGTLGVVCLLTLVAWPRPLMFYFGRWFASQGDPVTAARYDALWARPQFRTVNRRITLAWAVAFLGEFALRVAMALTLPAAVVLAAGPIVLTAITAGTIAWTFAYVRRARRRALAAGFTDVEAAFADGNAGAS
ncbi:MAG TPA: VC0807 family protein [Candidatus Elarobacter sp.]|jgi:hypothetical protein|nr:VC0807 family protein [Candidatus Elarobacter sp.]